MHGQARVAALVLPEEVPRGLVLRSAPAHCAPNLASAPLTHSCPRTQAFLQATARVFWKVEGEGQFARDHQSILELNNWDHLAQEVLISTPRRFGKTISVSMFAAAMIFSAARVELSIYSTCKRISQKLLRNVRKFIDMIFLDLKIQPYKVVRENQVRVACHLIATKMLGA